MSSPDQPVSNHAQYPGFEAVYARLEQIGSACLTLHSNARQSAFGLLNNFIATTAPVELEVRSPKFCQAEGLTEPELGAEDPVDSFDKTYALENFFSQDPSRDNMLVIYNANFNLSTRRQASPEVLKFLGGIVSERGKAGKLLVIGRETHGGRYGYHPDDSATQQFYGTVGAGQILRLTKRGRIKSPSVPTGHAIRKSGSEVPEEPLPPQTLVPAEHAAPIDKDGIAHPVGKTRVGVRKKDLADPSS